MSDSIPPVRPHAPDPDNRQWAVVERAELFRRITAASDAAALAATQSAAAGSVTVITPNLRLAASLLREFDALQVTRGLAVWASADILSFSSWVDRCFDEALYSDAAPSFAGGLPQVLAPAAEQFLWQDIVRSSKWGGALLGLAQTGAQCRASWQLAQAWHIAGAVLTNDTDAVGGWPCNEDAVAFTQWARAYEKRTARESLTDVARLPDWVARFFGASGGTLLRRPACIVAYAFDIITPQQRALFDACVASGIEVLTCHPSSVKNVDRLSARLPCLSAQEELLRAAQWARARLESSTSPTPPGTAPLPSPRPVPRIGVVVPELQARRKEVLRAFSRVMAPRWNLPDIDAEQGEGSGAASDSRIAPFVMPFNISLGMPLSEYPLVDTALAILALAFSDSGGGRRHDHGQVDFAQISRLIRSPFIGGAESELAARARLDAVLRELTAPRLTLAGLLRLIQHATDAERRFAAPPCTLLTRHLATLIAVGMEDGVMPKRAEHGASSMRAPTDWARHFSRLLEAMGFPGERSTDSAEFQTIEKWRETLGELAGLERVAKQLTQAEALAHLRRLCADTLFQPESTDKPIQILGILESAGLAFDHLWVSGLTDDAWPLAARPDPFIPPALQRKAGIPQAAANTALELDARITADWQGAAGEVLFSHPLREGDRELICSPLIKAIGDVNWESLGVPETAGLRERIFASGRMTGAIEAVEGDPAPARPPTEGVVAGGTRVLADQAACPFRAFARHRLGAETLQVPAAGLDAAARGQLLHTLFARLWSELKTKAGLESIGPEAFRDLIDRSAAAAVARVRALQPDAIGERFAELERARLARLACEWLEVETGRDDFQVIAVEDARRMQAGGLEFRGRIDRMDRLADGSYALIDYKTGLASTSGWLGTPPDDPQLPLYAVNAGEAVSAVAFARLRTGDMRFDGLAREADLLPKVRSIDKHSVARRHVASWDELISGWRAELDALGRGFASGDARVAPRQMLKTCERCDLQPLCRVHERFSALSDSEDVVDAGEGDAGAEERND